MELAVMMRPALVATGNAIALPSLSATIGADVSFADVLLALDRGELRVPSSCLRTTSGCTRRDFYSHSTCGAVRGGNIGVGGIYC